jgi:hypothetical protein
MPAMTRQNLCEISDPSLMMYVHHQYDACRIYQDLFFLSFAFCVLRRLDFQEAKDDEADHRRRSQLYDYYFMFN